MAELKCKRCGTVLDPDHELYPVVEMADGTMYARCSKCKTPYKVPKGKVKPEVEPEVEPEPPAE